MSTVYVRLMLISLLGGALFGSIFVRRSIAQTDLGLSGWVLFAAVILTAAAGILGAKYNALLVGFNRIAIARRWDTLITGLTAIGSLFGLFLTGDLVGLVVAGLLGQLAIVGRNWALSRRYFRPVRSDAPTRDLRRAVWAAAWRSGLGVTFGYATVQIGSLLAALFLVAPEAVAYLLAARFLQMISQIANVPFYTHIPTMSERYAAGRIVEMLSSARVRFAIGSALMAAGAIALTLLAQRTLDLLGSEARVPSATVLSLLGVGFVADRITSMNLQLQSVANRIIWHWVNGSNFVAVIVLSIVLAPSGGAAGLAQALCLSSFCVGLPISALATIRVYPESGWRFQAAVSFGQLAVPLVALAIVVA